VTPTRVQFLLWRLYSEIEPELILAPQHQDFVRLAVIIAAFLHERFAHLRFDSGVKTFLTQPNTYGWDVKKKLIWLNQSTRHWDTQAASCESTSGEMATALSTWTAAVTSGV
jgi:hypothetical protein